MNSDDGNSSRPTPHRWQFSLQELFVFMTACAAVTWILSNWLPLLVVVVLFVIAVLLGAACLTASIAWQLTFGWHSNQAPTAVADHLESKSDTTD